MVLLRSLIIFVLAVSAESIKQENKTDCLFKEYFHDLEVQIKAFKQDMISMLKITNVNLIKQVVNMLNCGPFRRLQKSRLNISLDQRQTVISINQICDRYSRPYTNGSSEIRCEHGIWLYEELKCDTVTCPPLGMLLNGDIVFTNNTYGSISYISCDNGYVLNGNSALSCEESGSWSSDPPVCDIIHCPALFPPEHGSVSEDGPIPYNDSVTFNCSHRYRLIGNSTLFCQADGRWSQPVPVCRNICIVPNHSDMYKSIVGLHTSIKLRPGSIMRSGTKLTFTCNRDSYQTKTADTTCIESEWVPAMNCTFKSPCGTTGSTIENGSKLVSDDGSTVEYSCSGDFKLIGQKTRKCQKDLSWDGVAPACRPSCLIPSHDYGYAYPSGVSYIIEGRHFRYICNFVYNYRSHKAYCINGQLTPYPSC